MKDDARPTIEQQRARINRQRPGLIRSPSPPRHELSEESLLVNADRMARLHKGRRRAVLSGGKPGGPAPYGYRRDPKNASDIIVEPAEAAVVRLIFATYTAGWRNGKHCKGRGASLKRLCGLLAEKGISTRRGKRWSNAGLAWILRNKTYVGITVMGELSAQGGPEDGEHRTYPEIEFKPTHWRLLPAVPS